MTSERIYQQDEDGQWYYSRRGEHAGPFASQREAVSEMNKYINHKNRRLNSDLVGSSVGLVKSVFRRIAA